MSSQDILNVLKEQQASMDQIKQQLNKKKYAKNFLKDMKPIPFEEFIENINIILIDNLLDMKLPKYYMMTIIENLKKYDRMNRPIICSDIKNRKCHYFINGEWKQNKEFIKLLKNKIFSMVIDYIIKSKNRSCFTDTTLQCLSVLCDVEKYPDAKLFDKILGNLCDEINNDISNSNSDEE